MNVLDSTVDVSTPEAGPKPTTSLRKRQSPLAASERQIELLAQLPLDHLPHQGNFQKALHAHQWEPFKPSTVEIFQINIGKLCNMACKHCHVDAGPDRIRENMDKETIDACLRALDQTQASIVDITGGAPELNPHFRYLVEECVRRGKHVMDRCNLTILQIPKYKDLPEWFAQQGVEIVCSLPHYRKRNTDAQRGDGTYSKSIDALKRLNEVGYGKGDPKKRLSLVTNPAGAFLSSHQATQEREWKAALKRNYDIEFDRLIAINNMPISRYLEWLQATGNVQHYMELLVNAFNPATISGLMCRTTLSVSWDGKIYDCDFNQMLELDSRYPNGEAVTIHNLQIDALQERELIVGAHCFGCTAGAGSSCGGAIE